jgi:hypothetical protein
MVDLYLHSPMRLHDMMLNLLRPGITLPYLTAIHFHIVECYEKEGVSSSVSNVKRYVNIRMLLDSIFSILPVFIWRWEILTYLRRDFLPQGCLHNI